ncbi:MAG TPA: hypothetical protein VH593_03655 [Ktedonobacteraceae bacterium]
MTNGTKQRPTTISRTEVTQVLGHIDNLCTALHWIRDILGVEMRIQSGEMIELPPGKERRLQWLCDEVEKMLG